MPLLYEIFPVVDFQARIPAGKLEIKLRTFLSETVRPQPFQIQIKLTFAALPGAITSFDKLSLELKTRIPMIPACVSGEIRYIGQAEKAQRGHIMYW